MPYARPPLPPFLKKNKTKENLEVNSWLTVDDFSPNRGLSKVIDRSSGQFWKCDHPQSHYYWRGEHDRVRWLDYQGIGQPSG